MTHNEIITKVIFLGDFGVGKSSTIGCYCDNIKSDRFQEPATIGARFRSKALQKSFHGRKITVKLEIWDYYGLMRD